MFEASLSKSTSRGKLKVANRLFHIIDANKLVNIPKIGCAKNSMT